MADAQGQVRLIRYEDDTPEDLQQAISEGLKKGTYEAAKLGGESVASTIKFKLPLKVEMKNEIAFDLAALDVKPTSIHQVAPAYPYSLQAANIRGWVELEWVILANGTVAHIKALNYSHKGFVPVAIAAIRQSRWKPGGKNGLEVNTLVRQKITFNP